MQELTNDNKPIWQKWWFWVVFVVCLFAIGSSEINSTQQVSSDSEYSFEFNPEVSNVIKDNTITINAKYDCPDGAIMQITLISNNDIADMQVDEAVVTNGKTSSKFVIKSTETQSYAGSITFQFNAESLKQPKSVTDLYGSHGEKLEGDNAQEATFKDGSPGKNASITFDVPYPSEEAVKAKNDELFQEAVNKLIQASNGVILSIDRPYPGSYRVMVSNSSWYLSSEGEKQYFAEEMLRAFTQGETDYVSLRIYDESMNEVASSKMMGGMKIKK